MAAGMDVVGRPAPSPSAPAPAPAPPAAPAAQQERILPTSDLTGPPPGAFPTSHVGMYTLYTTIGEGAFGKVKIAVHRETMARVAIKIMDKDTIRDQDCTQQVRREIYVMRSLEHKHIVKLFEVLTSESKLYIVMELVVGGELFELIRQTGPLPEYRARHFFQQLVDGVDFCHKRGVAHRDLKPENLLVDENGDLKITDFGFSSMKGFDANTGLLFTQCGTPDYCAPEIIDCSKEGYNGAKVDAWSCGVVLYALLTGRLPFLAKEADVLYDLILACKPDYSLIKSPDARDLVSKLLVRDYNKRYDLAKVKRHHWFLVDYDGDDAKLIKKRPFFNKNPAHLAGSSSRSSSPHINDPAAQPPAMPNGHVANGAYAPAAYGDTPGMANVPPPAPTDPRHEASMPMHYQQQGMQGYHGDSATRNSHLAGRQMPPIPRFRDESGLQYGLYKPPSPDVDVHMRSPTPPTHAVITRVEDRPATPVRRQTSSSTAAAFKAAAMAAAAPQPSPPPSLGHLTVPGSPGFQNSPARIPSLSNGHGQLMPGQQIRSPTASYEPANHSGRQSPMESTVPDAQDETLSDQDSTEDYEDKPALQLELPLAPLQQRLRSPQNRNNLLQHSLHAARRRHDSDLGVRSGTSFVSPAEGPASMSSVQLQRNGGAWKPDSRSPRVAMHPHSDIPNSPPVVYSPSGATGTSYDRYRSVSPGFNSRQGFGSDRSSPTGSHPSAASSYATPWHSNSHADASSGATTGGLQSEIIAQHLWNMVCKIRGTDKPVGPKLSQDLRSDFNVMFSEMNQMSRNEDIAAVFKNFLGIFEMRGLSETPATSPGYGRQQNRSRGTSEMDDEYEDGATIESREELSSNGDRYGNSRRIVTDMSSEDEPHSWSPVVADTPRHQSDLAKRRNISDLINRMLKKTNKGLPGAHSDRTTSFTGDDAESASTTDLIELQRLMQDHHGGREESNIADDLLRLMNNESDDGSSMQLGSAVTQPAQSPTLVQSSRPVDAYTQVRYQGNIPNPSAPIRPSTPHRTTSGSNVPLPQEYKPGRFKEPHSMPARANSGSQRHSRKGVENDHGEVGTTTSGNRNDMATSMGMHDVPYYGSDKKNMTTVLRNVLQTMKVKNQKLGERHAQFRSSLPHAEVMKMVGGILLGMGAEVQIKRDTKRKMKCSLPIQPNWVLHAVVEVSPAENGICCVTFRRSKTDRGRTDTESFHTFFEKVRTKFVDEANTRVPANRTRPGRRPRRKTGMGRHMSDSVNQLSTMS